MNLLGLFLLVLTSALFLGWTLLWHPTGVQSSRAGLDSLWLLGAILLTLVLHELVHGLAIRIFGARPKYGVIWQGLMFYASAAGHAFQRNHYIVVALAPLVVGSLLGGVLLALPLPPAVLWIISVCAAINAAGAVGDVWITTVVLRYSVHAYVVDEKDGMRLFLPDQ
jgi:hypothetical protein